MYQDGINPDLNIELLYSEDPIIIGQDITEQYSCTLNACVDDFIVFDHALNDEEVAELRDVYSSTI